MDDLTIKQLRKRLINKAKAMGFLEEAEDLAQQVLTRYADKKSLAQNIHYAFIDVLRRAFGSTRTQIYTKKKALRKASSLTTSHVSEQTSEIRQESGNQLHYLITRLKGTERAIVCLYYLWGFNEEELAYAFGVTGSQINHYKKKAQKILEEYVKKKK